MRHILRGFTMFAKGYDFGYEVEELGVALPDEVYTDHKYGGTIMPAQVPILMVNNIEPTMKMGSYNPELLDMLMRPLGQRDTFTFRKAVVDEEDGKEHSHVYIYEGRLASAKPSAANKEGKSEIDYTIKGVWYMKYMVDDEIIHELGLKPARLRIRGVDHLAGINRALGR
jgi:Phage tail tube protein FII